MGICELSAKQVREMMEEINAGIREVNKDMAEIAALLEAAEEEEAGTRQPEEREEGLSFEERFEKAAVKTEMNGLEQVTLLQMYQDLRTEAKVGGAALRPMMQRITGALWFLLYEGKIDEEEDEELWTLLNEIDADFMKRIERRGGPWADC